MAVSIEDTRVPDALPNLEVLVGTYEEFNLGFRLTKNPEGGLSFVPSFTNHSHCGSIRSVATCKQFLASGSTDESIRLFNLKTRSEYGFLQQHNGTITCLDFFQQSFLFSGSDDGNVCVWNTRTWNCEKTLKAHEGGVTAISIHPSGKLALTVGKDRAMKTWNLIKGRTAYVTNIKAVADSVKWSPEGTVWAVSINNVVNIYEVKSAGIKHTIDFKTRVNFVLFLNEDTLLIGGEGPNIVTHSISQRKLLSQFKAHERRVKAAAITKLNTLEEPHLVTVSNDGFIKLWQILDINEEPVLVTQVDSTCRITCLSLWTEKNSNPSMQKDVKPLTIQSHNSSGVSVELSSPDKNDPLKLKSLLKRKIGNKAVIVKTTSGPFIAEPIKIRDDKRPRLTFTE
ncbi:p21-activated protein kinase-interacting protein 1-like [Daphnia pulex]|uniref:p21-activated protein kinase-interacting protein 1-like n=1 Tax=Daphnia pulex TaxID=6669 RepID=UPI001EE12572|nr:p21-activated protein kinase-interacting protein 1-like [Daphnia pulex]XP_046650678.1 p21-activated protein kinase-interacting protein 1-like [Daphnia pulicaria]